MVTEIIESLCFPSPLPAIFGILRKEKCGAEQTFREFPSGRPPLPWRLLPLLASLGQRMIQTSSDRRPFHPSHRTGPSLHVCDYILCPTFLHPFPSLCPVAAVLHLLPPSVPALSLLSPLALFPDFTIL